MNEITFSISQGIQRDKMRRAPLSPEEKKELNNQIKKEKKEKLEYGGFIPTEINLGHDTFSKLAVIYQAQLGIELKTKGKNIDFLSKVISSCITTCYNEMYASKHDLPEITPALNYKSHELYDLYQIASYRFSMQDEESKVFSYLQKKYKTIPQIRGNSVKSVPIKWDKNSIYDLITQADINKSLQKLNDHYKNTK